MTQTSEDLLASKTQAVDKLKERAKRIDMTVKKYEEYLKRAKDAYEVKKASLENERDRFMESAAEVRETAKLRDAEAKQIAKLVSRNAELSEMIERTSAEHNRRAEILRADHGYQQGEPYLDEIKFLWDLVEKYVAEREENYKLIRKVYYNR